MPGPGNYSIWKHLLEQIGGLVIFKHLYVAPSEAALATEIIHLILAAKV